MNENSESDSEKEISKCRLDLNIIRCYRTLYYTTKRLIKIEIS